MQSFSYPIGQWNAHAEIMRVDKNKLMAMIKVSGEENKIVSRHTVVFDHQQGLDVIEETKLVMKNLLAERYHA